MIDKLTSHLCKVKIPGIFSKFASQHLLEDKPKRLFPFDIYQELDPGQLPIHQMPQIEQQLNGL